MIQRPFFPVPFLQKILPFAGLLVLFAGCSNDDLKVEIYRTGKQVDAAQMTSMPAAMPVVPVAPVVEDQQAQPPSQQQMPSQQAPAMSSGIPASDFAWDVPTGWDRQPGSAPMRMATFSVPGIPGKAAGPFTASVVGLGGDAGGLVANVNRWRGQLGLPPADEASVRKSARSGKGNLGRFDWFRIVNEEAPEQSMLVALIPSGEVTLFVKLMAPRDVLSARERGFLALCRSIRRSGGAEQGEQGK